MEHQQQQQQQQLTDGAVCGSSDREQQQQRQQQDQTRTEEEEEDLLDKRKAWRKSPAFVSSSQLLELLKAGAYDGPDTTREEAEGGPPPAAATGEAVGQALQTEDEAAAVEAGCRPCEAPDAAASADTDPFDVPLCAGVGSQGEGEDPFLPEADPVLGVDGEAEEDDQDIFLSQTEEETMREAAIEAAAIREVFGAPDLKSLFAAGSAPSGTVEEEDQEAAAPATKRHQPDGKKRKRGDDDLRDENKLLDEGRTSEPATNEKRKKLEAGTAAELGAKAEGEELEESA